MSNVNENTKKKQGATTKRTTAVEPAPESATAPIARRQSRTGGVSDEFRAAMFTTAIAGECAGCEFEGAINSMIDDLEVVSGAVDADDVDMKHAKAVIYRVTCQLDALRAELRRSVP